MSEWVKYTGSDEQIAEMQDKNIRFAVHRDRYLYNYENFDGDDNLRDWFRRNGIEEYLICNPHPLADMIIRQAQTGQPVWVRTSEPCTYAGLPIIDVCINVTTNPDWNIPNAEYSFTSWED